MHGFGGSVSGVYVVGHCAYAPPTQILASKVKHLTGSNLGDSSPLSHLQNTNCNLLVYKFFVFICLFNPDFFLPVSAGSVHIIIVHFQLPNHSIKRQEDK